METHRSPWNPMELPEHSMAPPGEKVHNKLTYSSKDKRPPLPFGTLTLRVPQETTPTHTLLFLIPLPLLSLGLVWLSGISYHNNIIQFSIICVKFDIKVVLKSTLNSERQHPDLCLD